MDSFLYLFQSKSPEACNVSSLKGETKNSQDSTDPGDRKHDHSSSSTADRVSATGNSILGRKEFQSKLSAQPVTRALQRASRDWAGLELEVIDTPDILSPCAPLEAVCEAVVFSAPGPHAVLLVTQLGRYTEEDRQAVRRLQETFGVGVLAHTVLVFTRKEDLDGGSLEDYVRATDNRALRALVAECGGRVCALDNRAAGAERDAQVGELLALVERLALEHDGAPFTDDVYGLAWARRHARPEDTLRLVAAGLAARGLGRGCGRGWGRGRRWLEAVQRRWRLVLLLLGGVLLLGLVFPRGPLALPEGRPE
uniref:GTPase IMAP family member 1-like n=1 Tax=Panthera onca TaxID=9690 RepID=UPI0029536B37|nr:GTPase IMAP family member 1-like [Panthera onca]